MRGPGKGKQVSVHFGVQVEGTYEVVKADRVDDVVVGKVILVGAVIAVPRDDIEGGVVLLALEEIALVLGHNGEIARAVLERGNRVQKVARVGKAVGT